jgi:RNA polymerase sigma factor (sigma-70 family)
MSDLIPLVERAKAGDPTAFTDLVVRFQDMATGYAFSILGDFHLAQDAAQEAFLDASRHLHQLRLPQAFPGWLRKAVFKHCDRIKRRKTVITLPLDTVENLASPNDTAAIVEARETKAFVLDSVRALSDHHRTVMTLFYIKDLTQQEIADFLEVPVTTVNVRLHEARKKLKERMLYMVEDALHEKAPSNDDTFVEKYRVADLCKAAAEGEVKQVEAILTVSPHLVGVDLAGDDEHRALHHAVLNRRAEIVQILMDNDADPHQGIYPFRDATTPLVLAIDRAYDEIVEIIEQGLEKRRQANLCPNLTVTPEIQAFVKVAADGDEVAALRMMSEMPDLLNMCDENGDTALHHAARNGRARLVRALLKSSADVGKENLSGSTPLEAAAHNTADEDRQTAEGCYLVTGILLEAGSPQSLRVLVMLGDTQAVAQIAEDHPELFKPDATNDVKLLELAVQHNRHEMVRLLLDLGVDPDERKTFQLGDEYADSWGGPLWVAAGNGLHEIAELLVERGADVNGNVYASGDPMTRAFNNKDEKMKKLLYRYGGRLATWGAGLECETAAGVMAVTLKPELVGDMLGDAAIGGDMDLVGFCLRHIDWAMDDPRWYGILTAPTGIWPCGPHRKYRDFDRSIFPQILEMLLKHGADPKVTGRRETSLLHHMAATGKVWGKPHLKEDERMTFATLFLDYGATLDVRDTLLKSTPLAWAANWGRTNLVRLYLERGASPNLPDDEPWATPLAWAKRRGHNEIVDLLETHRATS